MDKLIPLIDYVLEQDLPYPIGRTAGQMIKYALFLKQKLEIWMFVPCKLVDGIWVVLEEKKPFQDHYYEWEEAKERCLFKDIKYTPAKNKDSFDSVSICKEVSVINYPKFWERKTVESLISYNLSLTASANKIINA